MLDQDLWVTVFGLSPVLRSVERVPPGGSADLQAATRAWHQGHMSNFDYLMLLNALAGRRGGDAACHPIMPWVTDFSFAGAPQRDSALRDLSMSKFRLTRGDAQLDTLFAAGGGSAHHITESLSDLTYHIYLGELLAYFSYSSGALSMWIHVQFWQHQGCFGALIGL